MIEMLRRSIGPLIRDRDGVRGRLWPAQVDANQLELALLNLAVNARDAMPDGGTSDAERAQRDGRRRRAMRLPPGDYVCLAVTDTGAGMDGRRWRARPSRSSPPRVGQGHRPRPVDGARPGRPVGRRAASVQPAGRRHHRRAVAAPRPGLAARAAAAPTGRAADPAPCAVLVVDDDTLISAATGEMLKDLGHQVVEAASGSRRWRSCAPGRRSTWSLSDEAMPGMRGTELAAEIRASWPDLPVILATGYAELPDEGALRLPI